MDSSSHTKKPNNTKISDIVSLQRILKKWKRIATNPIPSPPTTTTTSSSKSIKFIKRTFSFNDVTTAASNAGAAVPKGFVAVCVGKQLKRYVLPMEHLGHQAFRQLLREAEEEFGFQKEGVLRIPCDVGAFEEILKVVRGKTSSDHVHNMMSDDDDDNYDEQYCHQFGFPASPATGSSGCCSPSTAADSDQYHHHPQMCR